MKRTTSILLMFVAAVGNAAAVEPAVLLDRSFGSEGIALLAGPQPGFSRAAIRAVRAAPDGSIFIGGSLLDSEFDQLLPYIVKLNSAGHLEATFATDGRFVLPLDRTKFFFGAATGDVLVLDDGRLALAAGIVDDQLSLLTSSTSVIAVLTREGGLDPQWAGSGYRTFDFANPASGVTIGGYLGNLSADRDSRIYLSSRSGSALNGVARFLADGSLDASYGDQGIAWLPDGAVLDKLHLDADQRLWGAGTIARAEQPPQLVVARLLMTGELDSSYSGGVIKIDAADDVFTGSLSLDAQDRPVIGHATQGANNVHIDTLDVARLSGTGNLDPAFNSSAQHGSEPGIARIAIGGSEIPHVMAHPIPGGDILVIGTVDWTRRGLAISRLREDGTTDRALPADADGYPPTLPVLGNHFDVTFASAIDTHGRVLVGGISYGDQGNCLFLARLISDRLFADGQDPSDRPTNCPTP